MKTIFEFSDWNQLTKARASDYPCLRIRVNQYISESLYGTNIEIYDVDNQDVYYSGFVRIINSTVIPDGSSILPEDMVKVINSYGFSVSLIEPLVLPPNVITILRGLYTQGYNYISVEYQLNNELQKVRKIVATYGLEKNTLYTIVSDSPEYNREDFTWVKLGTSYSIRLLIGEGWSNEITFK